MPSLLPNPALTQCDCDRMRTVGGMCFRVRGFKPRLHPGNRDSELVRDSYVGASARCEAQHVGLGGGQWATQPQQQISDRAGMPTARRRSDDVDEPWLVA